MISELRLHTVKNPVSVRGRGLHSGAECGLIIHPSELSSGIVFVTRSGEVKACVSNVSDTKRGTTLSCGDAGISTVEHLLAAFAGMGIDNVRVEVSGPEIPAVDGSALPFVEMIESAGIEEQDGEVRAVRPEAPVWTADGGSYMLALPDESFSAHAFIEFAHPMIGAQALDLGLDAETFRREIAPARTFCTSDEIEAIQAQGLGLGGTPDNVVVAGSDAYSVPLRFENEFVRHKMLDLIGDLSLLGGRVLASVIAIRSSHRMNVALADRIEKSVLR